MSLLQVAKLLKTNNDPKPSAFAACKWCGSIFLYTANAKYCEDCRPLVKREQKRNQRQRRLSTEEGKERERQKWQKRRGYSLARHKERYTQRRKAILDAYGGRCACCGEARYEFLALDHVNNDGAHQRRSLGIRGGTKFFRWIEDNNYPDSLQVLCHNCNIAKGLYGSCPHSKPEGKPADESI